MKTSNGIGDTLPIAKAAYIKRHPYVGDDGIYVPLQEYVLDGTASYYRMVMSKEMFVDAYNKWIKGGVNDGPNQNE